MLQDGRPAQTAEPGASTASPQPHTPSPADAAKASPASEPGAQEEPAAKSPEVTQPASTAPNAVPMLVDTPEQPSPTTHALPEALQGPSTSEQPAHMWVAS